MNARIFGVRAMERMCAQARLQFILSSERASGNGVRTQANSKGKIPSTLGSEEGWTRDAASCRTVSPTHYQLNYSGPWYKCLSLLSFTMRKQRIHHNFNEGIAVAQRMTTVPWNRSHFDKVQRSPGKKYTIQNKLRTNCSQTCQRQSFELNDLKF